MDSFLSRRGVLPYELSLNLMSDYADSLFGFL